MKQISVRVVEIIVLLLSPSIHANNITVLNHNFDSDVIPPDPGWTTHISGWVNSGLGEFGVYAPNSGSLYFTNVGNRGQVAYLNQGARMTQTVNASLLQNETYTLKFDVGQRLNHNNLHFIIRVKAKGLVLAQLSSTELNLISGDWITASLTFTATSDMPIGEPLVVEFSNLATTWQQVAIDNVFLTTADTGTTSPGTKLGPLTMIMEDTTLLVPDQYPNINAALRYLDDKQIKVGKTVKIQVTDCTNQTYTESINVAHPNGNAIHIVGDTDNPTNCILQFNGANGFLASGNNEVGLIQGFSLVGTGITSSAGIYATNGATINVGQGVEASNFGVGFKARYGGQVFANNTRSFNNSRHGYSSEDDSALTANYTESFDNQFEGYHAKRESYIQADYSTARNNRYGYASVDSSHVSANFSSSNDNSLIGYYATGSSQIHSRESSAMNNPTGYHCDYISLIDRLNSQPSGNGSHYSPNLSVIGNSGCIIK